MVSLRGGLATIFSFVLSCSLALSSQEDTVRDASIIFDISESQTISLPSRELSSKCRDDVTALKNGFVAREMWALRMIDAASKFQSGFLAGKIRDLGVYDECVGIRAEQNSAHIQGRHCMFSMLSSSFSHANNTKTSWKTILVGSDTPVGKTVHETPSLLDQSLASSICVPSTCDSSDVVEIVNTILAQIPVINELDLNVSAVSCSKIKPDDLALGEILTIVLLGIVGTFIISSTVCDLLLRKEGIGASGPLKLISKFSILKSTAAVFNTKILPGTIPAIHGIRFLSICWVIMGHRYLTELSRPLANLQEIFEWKSSWALILLQSAPFAVDTFFVVSGFLGSYVFLNALRAGRKMDVPMLYLHRYVRSTPAVVIVILFTAFLLPRMGSGVLWEPNIGIVSESCKSDWWRYLLYIQNYGHTKPCMFHAWYLAVDMQLFWISPLILYPLHRWPKWGLTLLWSFLVASIVTPATILGVNRYSNSLAIGNGSLDFNLEQFENFYIPSYCRATAYLIGIFLGYEVVTKMRKLSKMQVRINWLVTCCLLLACAVSVHPLYESTYVYNIYWEIIISIFARLCWPIGISWIIYASIRDYGGLVTRFLSMPPFLPLSRLSYCAYLIHLQFQIANTASARNSLYITRYHVFVEYWSDLLVIFALSIVLSVFIESPIILLEKIIKGNGSKREKLADPPPPQPVHASQERTAETIA